MASAQPHTSASRHATPTERRTTRPAHHALTLGVLLSVFSGAWRTASGQYGPVDPYDSAVRALKEPLAGADGEQHAAMVALRELRDPSIRPLLESLVRSDDWSLRVDSILGLAEIASEGKVDIALIERLPTEGDQETSIGAAIALELLDRTRVDAMLAWEDSPASQRLMLLCESRRLGGTPDLTQVERLSSSKTAEISGVATALLLDLGHANGPAIAERVRGEIAQLPPKTRAAAVALIAEAAARNHLKGAAPFAASLFALPDIPSDARLRTLGSLLVLSPKDALPLLRSSIDADRSQTALMRHGAVMLASGVRASKAEWDQLRNGDVLLEGMADAGTLLGEERDAEAYAKLLELRHRIALRAAVDGSERLGESSERALGIACAKFFLEEKRAAGPLVESLLRAIARLAKIAPEELRPLVEVDLESDRDARGVQESALIALAAAGTEEATAVAQAARGRTTRVGDATIAVLSARKQSPLTESDRELLATVAGGGADVSPALRTQAAWLWLRHANRTQDALQALSGSAVTPQDVTPKESTP